MSINYLILICILCLINTQDIKPSNSTKSDNQTETKEEKEIQPTTSQEQKEIEKVEEEKKEEEILEEAPPKILTIPLPYENNEDFLITALGIGTPRTYFPVQVDTTTSATWIPSLKCGTCKSFLKYNSSASSTASENRNDTFILYDEDGNVKGEVTNDDIQFDKYIIKNFSFIQATELSEGYRDYEDGKLGLGYHHSNGKEMNFLEMLKENDLIEESVFSIKELNESYGEITIGKEPFTEEPFPYCNISSTEDLDDIFKESWVCELTHLSINLVRDNESLTDNLIIDNAFDLDESLISFDTASSYIIAPYEFISLFENEFFNKYYSNVCRKINIQKDIAFICNKDKFNNETIKNITNALIISFVIDGNSFNIDINKLFEPFDKENVEFFIHFRQYNNLIWNIGHPFVHHYTLVFDAENARVGLIGEYTDVSEKLEKLKKSYFKNTWQIVLFIIAVSLLVIILFLIIFGIYRCVRRKVADKNEKISLVNHENKP